MSDRPVLSLVVDRSKPCDLKARPNDDFRKALAAISILSEMSATEALLTMEHWVDRGLLSDDEHYAIKQFYRIIP